MLLKWTASTCTLWCPNNQSHTTDPLLDDHNHGLNLTLGVLLTRLKDLSSPKPFQLFCLRKSTSVVDVMNMINTDMGCIREKTKRSMHFTTFSRPCCQVSTLLCNVDQKRVNVDHVPKIVVLSCLCQIRI